MPLGCRFMAGAACAARTAQSATSAPQHPSAQRFAAGAGCSRAAMLVSLHESIYMLEISNVQNSAACRRLHCRDSSLFFAKEQKQCSQHCVAVLGTSPPSPGTPIIVAGIPGVQCRQLAISSTRLVTRWPAKLAMPRLGLARQHASGAERQSMRPGRTPQGALLQPARVAPH